MAAVGTDGTSAAELAALEHRMREVFERGRADVTTGGMQFLPDAVERDMLVFLARAESAPSVISVAQRYALLVPAAAALGVYTGSSAVVPDCAGRIDAAFAGRRIPVPRLADFIPNYDVMSAPVAAPVAVPLPTVEPAPAVLEDAPPAVSTGPVPLSLVEATAPVGDDDRQFWPFPNHDDNAAEPESLEQWVRSRVLAGDPIIARQAATFLGMSDRSARRRIEALRKTQPDLFNPPMPDAAPNPTTFAPPAVPDPVRQPDTGSHAAVWIPPAISAPQPNAEVPAAATPAPSSTSARRATPVMDAVPAAALAPSADLDEDVEATMIRPLRTSTTPQPLVRISTTVCGELALTGSGVIGRAPAGDGALVRFPDPERLISKSHLAFQVTAEGLDVIDLRSGNGSQIYAGDTITDCVPGTRYRIHHGERVRLGDVYFQLT